MENGKKARNQYFDLLNVSACFSVVVLHSTGQVFNYSPSGTWTVALLLQTLCHFSVPVFFMLSGATLLEYRKRYTTREYFRKRWQRIGIPFIFWTLFYILWNQLVLHGTPLKGPLNLLNIFMNNGASNIFWFFYALLPIYLLFPLLSLVDWQNRRRVLFYLLCVCFIYNQIMPVLSRFFDLSVTSFADFPFKNNYVDYALLGLFLRDMELTKRRKLFIFLIGAVGFAGMAGGTWYLSSSAGKTDAFFMDYHSVFCYFLAIFAFIFARILCDCHVFKKTIENKKIGSFLPTLAGASFGVYLTHLLVMTGLSYILKFPHPVLSMTVGALIIYTITVSLTVLAKKTPVLKAVFP